MLCTVFWVQDCAFILQDLTLKHGWRTGAIIPELRKEIKIMDTEQYVHMMTWLQALTGLIEQMQVRRLNTDICVSILCGFSSLFSSSFFCLCSNVCTQTGTQRSSISSCCRGMD